MQNPLEKINVFAKTNFRNQQVPFGIKPDDRRRHMYIIGKTGMGKTTLMENMVIQDIRNGHGVCFIDPHGDSVVKILDFVPPHRVNDVVYFNPADLEHPIAFNILESVESRYKHLVASGLMGVFTKIWANMWSSRMEYILNNTILALLDSPGNTMLGVVRMYVDKKYRKKIVDNIKDPMVKAFWVEEFANYNERYRTEAVAPIQNKVGQFLSSGVIRNIIGQSKSTLDLRDIMDNRKILLLDLSKGKVGEDNSALLGAMIITKLQLAALSRVDIPEEERKDFYLYVDEFQNFVTDSFATILSEARKYRLNLIMGHQYIGQLTPDGNNRVRDAVFGNVGTMVVFRVGAADADYLEIEFEPSFTPTDIVNLPKYHIILKLMINGVASDPFTAMTLPVDEAWRVGQAEKVIKVSRERYSKPREQVEEKISRWMGAEFHEASAHSASGELDQGDDSEDKAPVLAKLAKGNQQPADQQSQSSAERRESNSNSESKKSNPSQSSKPQTEEAPKIRIASDFLERIKQKQTNGSATNEPIKPNNAAPKQQTKPRQPKPQAKFHNKSNFKNKPAQKKDRNPNNDIWSVAQQLQKENNQQKANNIAQALDKALVQPSAKTQPGPAMIEQSVSSSRKKEGSTEFKPLNKPSAEQSTKQPSEQTMQAGKTYEL